MSDEEYLKIIENFKKDNKDDYESGKIRKVFLECLPKYEGGIYNGLINWKGSINYKIYFIYKDIEGFVKIIDYPTKNKITIIYKQNKRTMKTDDFKKCTLGVLIKKVNKEYYYEIGDIIETNTGKIEILEKIKIGKDKIRGYKYQCLVCNNIDTKSEYDIKRKRGCGVCCIGSKKVSEIINSIVSTDPWMIKYFQGGYDEAKLYTRCSNQSIQAICPHCGNVRNKLIKIVDIFRYDSINCPCRDGISYPNKFMFGMLKELNFNFTTEYSPDWIKPKRYDFYIPSMNVIIEMDGELGHGKNKHSKSNISKEESKSIDDYKDEMARQRGIEVIRIDCAYENKNRFNFIKQNASIKLKSVFNLSIINWNKIKEYSLSNLVKEACENKKNNPNLTTGDIGELMGYDRQTILKWLKQGNGIWCNYDPYKEMRNSGTRQGKRNSYEVICVNDGNIFSSACELSRQSLKVYSTKLFQGSISAVCLGNKLYYKGFQFKYIKDLSEEQIKEIQENAKLNQEI